MPSHTTYSAPGKKHLSPDLTNHQETKECSPSSQTGEHTRIQPLGFPGAHCRGKGETNQHPFWTQQASDGLPPRLLLCGHQQAIALGLQFFRCLRNIIYVEF